MAAHNAELTDKPLPRTIFGHNMVLYRQSSGTPAALIDRCSHRLAPLSLGRVQGDLIRCGYHGALFDANGECKTEVPKGLEASACAVRSFPIVELHGFIWVWPGDASIADKGGSIAPFVRTLDDEDSVYSDGSYISLKALYSLVVYNLIDSTHGQYVHETTLGCDGLQSVGDDNEEDFKVDVGPNIIHFEVDLKNGEAGRCFH